MRNQLFAIVLSISLLSCFTKCTEEEDYVDGQFKDYVESFEAAATSRNIIIDLKSNPIEIRLENHPDDFRFGWCDRNNDIPNKVTINSFYWDVMTELEKEKLIFHELGHCVLLRPHLDRIRPDGFCFSIMQSGTRCSDNYSLETREAYLDELFLR